MSLQSPAAQTPTTPLAPVSRFFVLSDLGERPADPLWQCPASGLLRAREAQTRLRHTAGFTARDFAICNAKVVRTATWARGAAWDAPAGQLGPALYTNFQVSGPAATEDATAWSNTQLQWINDHLKADGYDLVP